MLEEIESLKRALASAELARESAANAAESLARENATLKEMMTLSGLSLPKVEALAMIQVEENVRTRRRVAASSILANYATSGGSLRGLRIIIVEDSATQSKLMMNQLLSVDPGWMVRSVSGPVELINDLLLCDFQVDLLVIDMNLGVGDGNNDSSSDGARLIAMLTHEYPESMHYIVPVLTSAQRGEREVQAVQCGTDFWLKPLPPSPTGLESYIRRAFGARAQVGNLHEGVFFGPYSPPRIGREEPLAKLTLPDNLKVLIVEDCDAQRKIMKMQLQACSTSIKATDMADAASCADFLAHRALCDFNRSVTESSEEQSFDVVFIDMNLGDDFTDGVELVRIVRSTAMQRYRQPKRKVILGITASSERSVEKKFLDAGADAVWSKPLPPTPALMYRLNSLLLAKEFECSLFATILAISQPGEKDDGESRP